MDIQDIRQTLFSLGEDDYKRFMSSLLPNIHPDTIIGVRLPVLRKIAKRIARGEAHIVLGTRSAVFAPLENLGLIVLDEEQESSYESENAPSYHARDIAKYRCAQEGARLLLGSRAD